MKKKKRKISETMGKLLLKTRLRNQLNKNLARKSAINNLELQKAKTTGDVSKFNTEFRKRRNLYDDWNAKQQAIKGGEKTKITENPLIILRKKGGNILGTKTIEKLENKREKIIIVFGAAKEARIAFMRKILDTIIKYKSELAKLKKEGAPAAKIITLQNKINANKKLMDNNQIHLKKLSKEYRKQLAEFDNNVTEVLRRLKAYNFRKGIYKKK